MEQTMRRPINKVLSDRIIDLALADAMEVNKGKTSFDFAWYEAYADANIRVSLELLKEDNPNQNVRNLYWDYGFIGKGTLSYDLIEPLNDVERWIVDRNVARANKDFAKGDEIRKKIIANHYEVNDLKDGVNWFRWTPKDVYEDTEEIRMIIVDGKPVATPFKFKRLVAKWVKVSSPEVREKLYVLANVVVDK